MLFLQINPFSIIITNFASLNIVQIEYLPSGHIKYINLQQLPDYRPFLKEVFLLYNSFVVSKMCGHVGSFINCYFDLSLPTAVTPLKSHPCLLELPM